MAILDSLTVNGHPLGAEPLIAADFYEWQPLEIACSPAEGLRDIRLHVGEHDLGRPTSTLGDPRWRWSWNPQHAVGEYPATLQISDAAGHATAEAFRLRIFPSKLDGAQYEALLAALRRDVQSIVYALVGGEASATLKRAASQTWIEELHTVVDGLIAEALAVVRQIDRRPQTRLVPERVELPLGAVENIDAQTLAGLARSVGENVPEDLVPELQAALRPPGQLRGGPLPQTVPAQRSAATTDLLEHRLLRHVLRVLLWRIGYVREVARREGGRRRRNAPLLEGGAADAAVAHWVERCNTASRSLRAALALPWLRDAGELQGPPVATALMRRDPRYRRVYALYRNLRTTPFLAFDSPALWLPLQELPALYEQWCALQVVAALLPLGTVENQALLEPGDDVSGGERRWTLRLAQSRPLLEMRLPDGAGLAVWYQRRYTPGRHAPGVLGALDPFVRIPDIAIEIRRPETPPRVLIFDAKYRVAPGGGVPQSALDDAYAYRSAIGADGARATLGAFLLFPGSVPLQTTDNVGALPLLPDASEALTALLRERLTA